MYVCSSCKRVTLIDKSGHAYNERDEDEREAHSNDRRRDRRHPPRHGFVSACPAEEENADDKERARDDRALEPRLWRRVPPPVTHQVCILARKPPCDPGADRRTDAHADEDEAGQAGCEAAVLVPDERERLEDCIVFSTRSTRRQMKTYARTKVRTLSRHRESRLAALAPPTACEKVGTGYGG
jgi:hypothetical protein